MEKDESFLLSVYRVERLKASMHTEELNKMLEHGWKLLSIEKIADPYGPVVGVEDIYIVGATKEVFEKYSYGQAAGFNNKDQPF